MQQVCRKQHQEQLLGMLLQEMVLQVLYRQLLQSQPGNAFVSQMKFNQPSVVL
jgi:hypothetical protein